MQKSVIYFSGNAWCVVFAATCRIIPARTLVKAKFHYAILVADRSEDGRRPAASWNLVYHLAR